MPCYLLGDITAVSDAGAIEVEVLAGQTLIRARSPAAILVALIGANSSVFLCIIINEIFNNARS